MTKETKDQVLEIVSKMMDDPGCEVWTERGILHYPGHDGWMHAEPTNGLTVTIKVNGGAKEIHG